MDPFQYLDSLGQFRMRMGLSRMKRLMARMEHPELSVPSVLVAGTNGKGSTCAMADAMLSSFPVRRAMYTSPHLERITERLLMDGTEVEDDTLGQYIMAVKELSDDEFQSDDMPTYFEHLTASCFKLASDRGMDALVSEVGLGGRFDATNVLEPAAVAITSISLDHQEHLGHDTVSIAGEKAGIIKPSTPVVIGPMGSDSIDGQRALRAVLEVCSMNGCPVVLVHRAGAAEDVGEVLSSYSIPDWRVLEVSSMTTLEGTHARIDTTGSGPGKEGGEDLSVIDEALIGTFTTPLLGEFQGTNMVCAAALSLLLLPSALAHSRLREGDQRAVLDLMERRNCLKDTYTIDDISRMLHEGLRRTVLKGRLERRTLSGRTLVLDGGHNEEAGRSISSTISRLYPGKKVSLLLAMMKDKDAGEFSGLFRDIASCIVLTRLPMERSMPVGDLLRGVVRGMGGAQPVHLREELKAAFESWIGSIEEDGVGIACGSFYLYRPVSEMIRKRSEGIDKDEN